MITKLGQLIDASQISDISSLGIAPVLFTAKKSMGMTPEESDALKEHYNLDDDAWLKARNFGRGLVGSFIGALPGSTLTGLAEVSGNPELKAIGTLAGLAGSAIGAHIGTNKYSRSAAQDIIKEREKKEKYNNKDIENLLRLAEILTRNNQQQ